MKRAKGIGPSRSVSSRITSSSVASATPPMSRLQPHYSRRQLATKCADLPTSRGLVYTAQQPAIGAGGEVARRGRTREAGRAAGGVAMTTMNTKDLAERILAQ